MLSLYLVLTADYQTTHGLVHFESNNLGRNFVKQISKQDAFGIFTLFESKNCLSVGI